MRRILIWLLIVGNILLVSTITQVTAQEPDGTVKITRRSVAEAVGLSWGDGVLTYKGKDYFFSFQASGLLRDVDPSLTAAELSGQIFNLKKLEDFNGNYKLVEAGGSVGGGGELATIRNQNGVVVNVIATTGGHKFTLGPDGLTVELKK
ncbi:MAG TPA: hypothetical protein VGA09_20970 [Candidatus Binatia bacterium]